MSIRRFRLRLWLTSAIWAPVLAVNVVASALGVLLPWIDESLVNEPILPVQLSSAEQLLGALAAGMITFTGIVFSAVLVAAQIQTSAYSPRIAARLRRDRVLAAGLALSTGTASYALFALYALGRQANELERNAAPALTVALALLLAFATFCAFVALVQRAFDATQIGGILRSLMRQAQQVVREVHPERGAAAPAVPLAPAGGGSAEFAHVGAPGVVASVDRDALVRLADRTGAFVEVLPRVGEYVPGGAQLLRLHGGGAAPDPQLARRVLVLARQRTMDQDPAFALRMFVDIAIRGLSPAVNDPTTAVQTLDRIETLLVDLSERRLGPFAVDDERGEARGIVPAPSWEEYVALGLTEVRHYGATSAQLTRRLHALYDHLVAVVDEGRRAPLERERRLLDEAVAAAYPPRPGRSAARTGSGSAAPRAARARARPGARAPRGRRGRRSGAGAAPGARPSGRSPRRR